MKRGLRVLQLCLLAVVLIGLFLIVRQTKGEQTTSAPSTVRRTVSGSAFSSGLRTVRPSAATRP